MAPEQHVGRAADADQHHAGDADRLVMHPAFEPDDDEQAGPRQRRRKMSSASSCISPIRVAPLRGGSRRRIANALRTGGDPS